MSFGQNPLRPPPAVSPKERIAAEPLRVARLPLINSAVKAQIERLPTIELEEVEARGPSGIPPDYVPWWQPYIARPLWRESTPAVLDVETLVLDALRDSPQVRAISDNYLISRTAIAEAAAAFDVHAFTESKFVHTNEPVGNTLTTGGPPRYLDDNWGLSAGMRKKTSWGGSLEASQRIGLQDSNSIFFVPPNQGNARLSLSFSQPLLNGAGKVYSASLIVLANIDAGIARAQTAEELQRHLIEVSRSYWELYLHRATLLQKTRLFEQAQMILTALDRRQGVDTLQSQLLRAQAAVAARRADLIRAEAAIKNAEARLRALVYAPDTAPEAIAELIPSEPPARQYVDIDMRAALVTAVQNRPDVDRAMKLIQAANVRLKVSQKELLPILNLVLETYVSGLRGSSDIGRAMSDQMSIGAPSYTTGLVFDVPMHNRAARARFQRRQLEVRQLTNQFVSALQLLSAEVEVAVRELKTTYGEMHSKYQAMLALEAEAAYLYQRWQILPGEDRSASFVLEDLLDVQERLAFEEFGFVKAQVDYSMALNELKRTTGTLLQYEQITVRKLDEAGTPRLIFEKAPFGPPSGVLPGQSSPLRQ